MTINAKDIYCDSHRALAFGQQGLLGGAIGTVVSGATGAVGGLFSGFGYIVATGARDCITAGVPLLFGTLGLVQGTMRYPVHCLSRDQLDTTSKKIKSLALQFFITTIPLWAFLIAGIHGPLVFVFPYALYAATVLTAMTFPATVLSNVVAGQALIGLKKGTQYCINCVAKHLPRNRFVSNRA